jgi:hypothetical protein
MMNKIQIINVIIPAAIMVITEIVHDLSLHKSLPQFQPKRHHSNPSFKGQSAPITATVPPTNAATIYRLCF